MPAYLSDHDARFGLYCQFQREQQAVRHLHLERWILLVVFDGTSQELYICIFTILKFLRGILITDLDLGPQASKKSICQQLPDEFRRSCQPGQGRRSTSTEIHLNVVEFYRYDPGVSPEIVCQPGKA